VVVALGYLNVVVALGYLKVVDQVDHMDQVVDRQQKMGQMLGRRLLLQP
jgi:hypothetical protein